MCWRTFDSIAGRTVLRPDLYVALGVGEYERRFFIEVDRATEHLPTIVRKGKLYEQYYRSGREQAASEVFPKVLFVTPDDIRAGAIISAIHKTRSLTSDLFTATADQDALDVLIGGEE